MEETKLLRGYDVSAYGSVTVTMIVKNDVYYVVDIHHEPNEPENVVEGSLVEKVEE